MFAFFPGISELLIPIFSILLFATFVYTAIRRLQQKLGPGQKPTAWTYINELGGYIVVGLIFLLGVLAVVLLR